MQDWIWGQDREDLSNRFVMELAEAQRLLKGGGLLGLDSIAEIVARVRAGYGKPLSIEPVATLGGLAGLYNDFGTKGEIWYYESDATSHQLFTICHELMHALGKHKGCTILNPEVKQAVEVEGLTLAAARGRGANVDFEEIVAELGAHYLMWQVMQGLAARGRMFPR